MCVGGGRGGGVVLGGKYEVIKGEKKSKNARFLPITILIVVAG